MPSRPTISERVGKSGPGMSSMSLSEQLGVARVGVVERVGDAGGEFAQVVRRNAGGHADGDALGAVHQQVRDPRGQDDRLDGVAGVVGDEVDGLLVDVLQHRHGQRGEPALGVAHRRRRVVARRAEVALRVDQRVAQRPRLRHAHEGVVEGRVTVRVVVAHHVAHDAPALDEVAVGSEPGVVHAVEDLAVHRLQPVTHVGQRPSHDHRHRIVDVAALHLRLDVHRFDPVVRSLRRFGRVGHSASSYRDEQVVHRPQPIGRDVTSEGAEPGRRPQDAGPRSLVPDPRTISPGPPI